MGAPASQASRAASTLTNASDFGSTAKAGTPSERSHSCTWASVTAPGARAMSSAFKNARKLSVVALWKACVSNHFRRNVSNSWRPYLSSRNLRNNAPCSYATDEYASSGSRPVMSGSSVLSRGTVMVDRESARSATPIIASMSARSFPYSASIMRRSR